MDIGYLTPNELKKVLTTAASYGSREACMFTLAYGHALRASEIASLTLDDVKDGKISCRRGKKSEHTIEALRAHEREALARWIAERGDGDGSCFLFTSPPRLAPLTPTDLQPFPQVRRTRGDRRRSHQSAHPEALLRVPHDPRWR